MTANRDIRILGRCFRLVFWNCGVDPPQLNSKKKKNCRANTFTYSTKRINKTLKRVHYLPPTYNSFRNVCDVGHISILISHRPLQAVASGLDFSIYTSKDEHAAPLLSHSNSWSNFINIKKRCAIWQITILFAFKQNLKCKFLLGLNWKFWPIFYVLFLYWKLQLILNISSS